MRKLLGLFVMLTMVFVLAACGDDTPSEESADTPDAAGEEEQVFTLEELGEYDGQDGKAAYVAVDGVVYDVTNVGAWKDGKHPGGLEAGGEHTENVLAAPHGESVLKDLPVVGKLE